MKKTLFLIFAIFFISIEIFSQTNIRTDKYRTIQSGLFTDDGVIEWGDTDFLITITTNNFVKFSNILLLRFSAQSSS